MVRGPRARYSRTDWVGPAVAPAVETHGHWYVLEGDAPPARAVGSRPLRTREYRLSRAQTDGRETGLPLARHTARW